LHVNYEYILAGIVLLLILWVTEMNIVTVMTHQLTKMEQETEYPAAGRILDMILLSPGYPSNWGNLSGDPLTLGFAVQNALRAYALDISKVSRLKEESLGYISPGKARALMGLSEDYHFNLTIVPVFNIEIVNASSEGQIRFNITVTDHRGFRVPNVNVTGFYIPSSWTGGTCPSESVITALDGSCILTFDPLPDRSLVVCATELNVKVVQTDPAGLSVRVEGGYVTKSDFPAIESVHYATGSVSSLNFESAFRYAEIDGVTYYVKFDLWG